MEYINDLNRLSVDDVDAYCDRVSATEWERHHLTLKADAAYEWAHFLRDVYDFTPLRRFVRPGTFYNDPRPPFQYNKVF